MKRKKRTGKADLPVEIIERVADMLKVMAHPHRIRIVEALEQERSLPVFEVMTRLDLPQAVTSQHLNAMKRVGLLSAKRRGKEVWYAINDPRALTILECIRRGEKDSRKDNNR